MHNQTNYQYLKTSILPSHILYVSLTFVLLNFIDAGAVQVEQVIKSPDGNIVITFDVKDFGDQSGCPVYSVGYKSRPIVVDSRLGLALKDAPALETGFNINTISSSSNNNIYSPVYGERRTIRDHYNQLAVELQESNLPHRWLRLTFRAYNEGGAFCYTLPEQNSLKRFTISAEKTQFRFADDHTAYAVYSAQGQYSKVPLSKVKSNCERPLTIEINNGLFVSVAEARLVNYARMRLSPDKGRPYTLVSSLGSRVEADTPYTTPWRVLLLGDSPGQLLERNYLILNLNEPCAIDDVSWIKPGKVIREVTLTTKGGKSLCQFCRRAQSAIRRI